MSARWTAAAVCLALLVCGARRLGAQDAVDFKLTGEVDSDVTASAEHPRSVFNAVTPFQGMDADGVVDGKLSFSRKYTALGLLDFTATDTAVLSHQTGATMETPVLTINELYTDVNFGDLAYLRVGKQRLKWGAGYVYNPSDPVNPPKDPTATRTVREGVPAAKAELITPVASVAAFGVVFDQPEEDGVGGRLSTSKLPGTDLSLSGYWSRSESWTTALNASVAPLYDVPGWDTLQVWFEGGLFGQARYLAFGDGVTPGTYDGTQYSFLVGSSATLPEARTVGIVEYYHLSEGLGAGQISSVYANASPAWLAELARRPARQGRDYLFVSLTQPTITDSGDPVLDKIGLHASTLVNLTDGSFFTQAGITTAFVDNSSVELAVNWAEGQSDTEFGNVPARVAGTLTVRVYF
ncbi:MAG TPA: hypothetical protein VFI08_01845 [Spirochaetia bacterium]|nr:hypothetical protein [Spirochaetia bacterium]